LTQKGVAARWHPNVEEPIGQRDKGRRNQEAMLQPDRLSQPGGGAASAGSMEPGRVTDGNKLRCAFSHAGPISIHPSPLRDPSRVSEASGAARRNNILTQPPSCVLYS
jgi:hypothetical protein